MAITELNLMLRYASKMVIYCHSDAAVLLRLHYGCQSQYERQGGWLGEESNNSSYGEQ